MRFAVELRIGLPFLKQFRTPQIQDSVATQLAFGLNPT